MQGEIVVFFSCSAKTRREFNVAIFRTASLSTTAQYVSFFLCCNKIDIHDRLWRSTDRHDYAPVKHESESDIDEIFTHQVEDFDCTSKTELC